MDKANRRRHLTVSLFPFLSVLACLIGTLTLLLAGLALGQIAGSAPPPAAGPDPKEIGEEVAHLKELIAKAEALAETLRKAREELARRQREAGAAAANEKAVIELSAKVAGTRDEKKKAEEETERLRHKISRGTIQIKPSGSGIGLVPRFVECTAEGIVLDPDAPPEGRRFIERPRIEASRELKDLIRDVKDRPTWRVIFIVRPKGVKAFEVAAQVAGELKVKHGKLAAPGNRSLDFATFRAMKGQSG